MQLKLRVSETLPVPWRNVDNAALITLSNEDSFLICLPLVLLSLLLFTHDNNNIEDGNVVTPRSHICDHDTSLPSMVTGLHPV